jgi:uncharacterized protein YdiU (UPF0061 family)
LFSKPAEFDVWVVLWKQRLADEGGDNAARAAAMRAINPIYIPRNHLVEEALAAAVNGDDYSLFETMLAVLSNPFEGRPEFARYAIPPTTDQIVTQTFCGT